MLKHSAVIQVIRESTIETPKTDAPSAASVRLRQDDASVAWNLATTMYYKSGCLPWSLARLREGVCYIGLVFKKEAIGTQETNACCGAQMFLDSGESLVFKGAGQEIVRSGKNDYHLTSDGARQLLDRVLEFYKRKADAPPKKIFLRGKTYFSNDEWKGFLEAAGDETELVGIRIRPTSEFKLYRNGKPPVLRGTYFIEDPRSAYLWTRGFVPRLQTYPGREVLNPLQVSLIRGNAEMREILSDILSLTKVNYNACIFGDGLPVTLRFADTVGEILTSVPPDFQNDAPLPFKHYI